MSHEQTITVGIDNKFFNINTVVNGKKVRDEEAMKHATKTKTLGRGFETEEEAISAAEERSRSFDKEDKFIGQLSPVVEEEDFFDGDYLKNLEGQRFQEATAFIEERTGQKMQEEVPVLKEPERQGEATKTISSQVLANIADIPPSAATGILNAVAESVETLDDFQSFMRSQFSEAEAGDLEVISIEKFTEKFQPETTTGEVAKAFSQFLTGFIPIFRGLKTIKWGVEGAFKAKDLIPRAIVAGGLADMMVFDPKDGRVSNLLNELPPPLKNPMTKYLATSPDDTDAEGRLKNAIEGLGLGAAAEGTFIGIAKLMRRAGQGKLKKSELEKARKALESAEDETIKQFQAEEGIRSSASSSETGIPKKTTSEVAVPGRGFQEEPSRLKASIESPSSSTRYTSPSSIKNLDGIDATSFPKEYANELHKVSQANKSAFTLNIEEATGLTPEVRIKEVDSLKDKVARYKRRNKDLKTIPDILGGRIVVSESEITNQLNNIKKHFQVERFDDYFKDPTAFGYRGLNVTVRLPNGLRAEIQVHTPETLAKAKKARKFYNKWKNVDRNKLPEREKKKYRADQEKSLKVWQSEIKKGGELSPIAPAISVGEGTVKKAGEFFKTEVSASEIKGRGFLGKDININFDRMDTDEEIKLTMAKLAKVYQDEIKAWKGGTATHEETVRLAQESGLTIEDILALKPGEILPRAEVLAARHLEIASAKEVLRLADELEKNPEVLDAFMKQLGLHGSITSRVRGVATEAGRILESFKIGADGNLKFVENVRGLLEEVDSGMPPQSMAAKLRALETPEQLEKVLKKGLRPGFLDMYTEVWINGLLSNVTTQMVNVISNISVAVGAIPERALAARISFGPRAGGVVPGEASALLYGQTMSFMDAFRVFGRTMRTGKGTSEFTKVEGQITPKITAKNFELTGTTGRAVDLFGEVVRMPGRMLMSADEFFKMINYRGELHALSYRRATEEGLTGRAFAKRVAHLVDNPPPAMQKAASDFSHYQTFTNELGGIGKSVQSFTASTPAARFILPFTRTPTNIFKFTLERTPGLNLILADVRKDILKGGAHGDLVRARVALGSMLLGTASMLARAGYITGDGPQNPTLRKQMMDAGWQPNSIWVNGAWRSFDRVDPLGAFFGMAADFADISGEMGPDEADKMSLAMVVSVANNMVSKTYLIGLSNAMMAIVEPARGGERFVGSFERSLIPSGLRQIARATDPVMRETDSMLDQFKSGIPGWSKDLPPRTDVFGSVIPNPLQNAIVPFRKNTPRKDPVFDEIDRLRLGLSKPGRWMGGRAESKLEKPTSPPGVKLTSEQWNRRVVLAGNAAKDPSTGLGFKGTLARLFITQEYKELTDEAERRTIKSVQRKFRALGDIQLLEEFPDLAIAIERKEVEKIGALVGEENLPEELQLLLGVGQ